MAKIKPCGEGRFLKGQNWIHATTGQVVIPPLLSPRHYDDFARRTLNLDELNKDWDLLPIDTYGEFELYSPKHLNRP